MSPALMGAALVLSSSTVAIAAGSPTETKSVPSSSQFSQFSDSTEFSTLSEDLFSQEVAEGLSQEPAKKATQQQPVELAAASVAPETATEIDFSALLGTNDTTEVLEELVRSDNTTPPVTTAAKPLTRQSEANLNQVRVNPDNLEELARTESSNEPSVAELLGIQAGQNAQVAQALPSETNPALLDQLNRYSNEDVNGSMGQGVPGAAQFSDVSPNDWAFQALDDLVRRYDCLKGYPDGTYRGQRPLSRFEFAAGLNACLQQIERLIAASTADFVTQADLETLQRLIQEFEAELATLGTRVDSLEGRVAFLEDNQFSTTTKLSGEAIIAVTTNFGSDSGVSAVVGDLGKAVLGNRVRLDLNTSFTGRDRLVTRLEAGNLGVFRPANVANTLTGATLANSGSFEAGQTFNNPQLGFGTGARPNNVDLGWLGYYFPFGNSQAYISAVGGKWSDIAPTLNPYFEDFDGGKGSLSSFAQRNPIYRIGGGAGAALSFGFSPLENVLGPSTVTIGYMAGNPGTPQAGAGLVDGDYAILGQINANISDTIALGLTYVHGYHATNSPIFAEGRARNTQTGTVGSFIANNPSALLDGGPVPTVTNSYGAELAFRLGNSLSLSGFVTRTDFRLLGRGDGDIWTYGAGLAVPDLGRPGSVFGIFGGVQPTLRSIEAAGVNGNLVTRDTSWTIEGFYKFQLTDNISITPGVLWITDPNQRKGNDSAIIGTLRTTFSF
ncbi:iron uptake porin [Spirulina subsalsa FACHB-351]|uniref:Iron uptake porin n=1 Tax=Spirulina subsalsa FACHB-351 TaxID=234711 RepID=A0ABT3L1Y6_9CYAN|nr:iron uptake porin [Spirulina subsalsa]MCW6035462.1 iron uptake porin [Spirulina subsalsa FACHB-351]